MKLVNNEYCVNVVDQSLLKMWSLYLVKKMITMMKKQEGYNSIFCPITLGILTRFLGLVYLKFEVRYKGNESVPFPSDPASCFVLRASCFLLSLLFERLLCGPYIWLVGKQCKKKLDQHAFLKQKIVHMSLMWIATL